jgi:hypothetical protein
LTRFFAAAFGARFAAFFFLDFLATALSFK